MRAQGYLYALLTAAFFGAGAVLANRVTREIDPLLTTELNLSIGAALLAGYLVARRRPLVPRGLSARDWARVGFVAVVGTGLSLALVITGLSRTTPVNGGFLIQLQGPTAVLASVFLLGDRLRWWQSTGLAVTLAGGVLVVLREPGAGFTAVGSGDLLVLAGAVLAGLAFLPAKSLMARVPALQLSLWRLVLATVVLLPVLLLAPGPLRWHPGAGTLLLQLLLAVTNFCLAYVTLHLALDRLRPWETASVLQLEPAFTVVVSLLALSLAPTPLQLAGGVLMIAGGLVSNRPARPPATAPATEPATEPASAPAPGPRPIPDGGSLPSPVPANPAYQNSRGTTP
ncbi:DMT family transporter [Streptomyces sp. BE20]|uniref:DMT family transporter n=1 Tax=Streptomyces sp. BE20 TaxID=3002525 RepID=UPI002E79AEEA|nr:DMT family transporter [Streptomyces sp. BE20]MEE1824677.1 DMT family transporter [Streptomyces sp. BE20]